MASVDLPIEVIDLILSKLPSKSLLRFRCVCKPWLHLFSSHQFIKRHRGNNRHGHVLIQHDSEYSVRCDKTFTEKARFLLPCEIERSHGYSDGLICLSISAYELNSVCLSKSFDESSLHLWNPSIHKFKALPKPLLSLKEFGPVIAFCFVPRVDDYRLLRVIHDFPYAIDTGIQYLKSVQSEIYSLRTNSWKLVENTPFYNILNSSIFSVVNGVVYFMAFDTHIGHEILISFDMADEIFTTIKIHGVMTGYNVGKHEVFPVFFWDSLFLIHVQDDPRYLFESDDKVDVWERKVHDDGTESWSKTLAVRDWFRPLGFLKNGEMVCGHTGIRTTSYNPRRIPQIKDIPFGNVSLETNIVTYFVESLMLLDEGSNLVS